MTEALKEAEKAYKIGEVPVGAVIVRDNEVIARCHNQIEKLNDATAHAEILAIKEASEKLKDWRLTDCFLYVTLEPCPMCAGALIQARVRSLYFGAYDSQQGACGSVLNIVENPSFNHMMDVIGGIEEKKCINLLDKFFSDLR